MKEVVSKAHYAINTFPPPHLLIETWGGWAGAWLVAEGPTSPEKPVVIPLRLRHLLNLHP